MKNTYEKPADIEARSMEIIGEELESRGISVPRENLPVVRRVIHTTADFDYAETLVFTEGAVRLAIEAIRRGCAVVTDTNMARSGVSRANLGSFGGEAYCFMADPDVASAAKEAGCTRAAASMEKAARLYPAAVYAVGNAPTALFALADRIREGMRPSLVIGVPVGFVNVVEAKEEILAVCAECGIPAIVARGRKGGSTVAAAVCNALIYEAAGKTDPHLR